MGRKIDDATIIKINEVYFECGVKSKTAQIVGVSPSTVTKYLIPGYKSQRQAAAPVEFKGELAGIQPFAEAIITGVQKGQTAAEAFCENCCLSEEEWAEMNEIQKGVMI